MLPPELAGKIDDLMKADLQLWRDWCFHWLLISTGLVIVGVTLEGPELVYGTIAIVRRKSRRSEPVEPHRLPDWAAILGLLGWLLVVVGVAGEYVADPMVSKADGNILTLNDILLRNANKDAGYARTFAIESAIAAHDAKDESDKAKTSASNALALANGARSEADSFERDIVSAKTQAAEAESHLADALQRAANAERETARIKGELADRELTAGQIESIADRLNGYSGREYDVTAYWDSKESVAIAERVNLALQLAKWKFLPMTNYRSLLGGTVGILVWIHPEADERNKDAATSLIAALAQGGLPAEARLQNPANPRSNTIHLNVGSKR
jgi:hypothetical protein